MATNPSFVNPGFFRKPHTTSMANLKASKEFVDVGGQGDCGFRSVAATLLDNVLSKRRMNMDLINTLLREHCRYFSEHRLRLPGLVTPMERLQELVRQVPMAELVHKLAFTLRQIAVDEICQNPSLYRSAFVDAHESTAPRSMRRSNTWIDECSIAALANRLNMSIEMQVTQPHKELPLRLRYNEKSTTPQIVIQLHEKHYMPKVMHKERFQNVKQRALPRIGDEFEHADPTVGDLLKLIADEDERLVHAFKTSRHRLTAMVDAGELTKEHLLMMYVQHMGNSDYLQGRIQHVGTEYGTQHFFEAIERTKNHSSAALDSTAATMVSHEKHIINELVHALAQAVSIGHVAEEDLFAPLENHNESTSHRVLRG